MSSFIRFAALRHGLRALPRANGLVLRPFSSQQESGDSYPFSHARMLQVAHANNREEMEQQLLIHSIPTTEEKSPRRMIVTPKECMAILKSWLQSGSEHSGQKADDLLEILWREYKAGNQPQAKPDQQLYRRIIEIWMDHSDSRKRGFRKDGSERAQLVLEDLRDRCYDGAMDGTKIPNESYGMVMAASSKMGEVERTMKILDYQIRDYKAGIAENLPDIIAMNCVLISWARSSRPEAAQRAHEFFERILKNYRNNPNEDNKIAPNAATFTSVISCWARSNSPETAERVHQVLSEMKQLGDKIKPSIITYNAAIDAFASQGDTRQAELLMRDAFEEYQSGNPLAAPDMVTFSTILKAWSKSNREDAPEQSESILKDMWKLYNSGDIVEPPDIGIYTEVARSWSNSRRPEAGERAEQLLREAQELKVMSAKLQKNENSKFHQSFYNVVINAWSKSRQEQRLQKMFSLIDEMSSKGIRPGQVAFNTALSCITRNQEPTVKLNETKQVIELMQKYGVRPDNLTRKVLGRLGYVFDAEQKGIERK